MKISEIDYKIYIPLHHLENAINNIGLYVNDFKTEFVNFNNQGLIQTTSGESIKSSNFFTYLGSEINSSENDVKINLKLME